MADLGSSNGVYVLGRRIDTAAIREGDVFTMGDVLVRFLPEDVPATLDMPQGPAPVRSRPEDTAPPPVAAPSARPARRPALASAPPSRFASRVLAASSLAIGLVLLSGPLILGPAARSQAYAVAGLGVVSAAAGLGSWAGHRWARRLHYALFTLWTLLCLLAPFGAVGFAYQIRGQDHSESDLFFSVVLGLAGILAVITLVAASLLARIYVPGPLPL